MVLAALRRFHVLTSFLDKSDVDVGVRQLLMKVLGFGCLGQRQLPLLDSRGDVALLEIAITEALVIDAAGA